MDLGVIRDNDADLRVAVVGTVVGDVDGRVGVAGDGDMAVVVAVVFDADRAVFNLDDALERALQAAEQPAARAALAVLARAAGATAAEEAAEQVTDSAADATGAAADQATQDWAEDATDTLRDFPASGLRVGGVDADGALDGGGAVANFDWQVEHARGEGSRCVDLHFTVEVGEGPERVLRAAALNRDVLRQGEARNRLHALLLEVDGVDLAEVRQVAFPLGGRHGVGELDLQGAGVRLAFLRRDGDRNIRATSLDGVVEGDLVPRLPDGQVALRIDGHRPARGAIPVGRRDLVAGLELGVGHGHGFFVPEVLGLVGLVEVKLRRLRGWGFLACRRPLRLGWCFRFGRLGWCLRFGGLRRCPGLSRGGFRRGGFCRGRLRRGGLLRWLLILDGDLQRGLVGLAGGWVDLDRDLDGLSDLAAERQAVARAPDGQDAEVVDGDFPAVRADRRPAVIGLYLVARV